MDELQITEYKNIRVLTTQQIAEAYAIIDQSFEDMENVTNSLGFYLDYGNGKKVITPLSQVYLMDPQ